MRKLYGLDQSPLYKLSSRKKLFGLLGTNSAALYRLLRQEENYRIWPSRQRVSDGLAGIEAKKPRIIQHPKPDLFALHSRLAKLLARIVKPDYVYSATRGCSYDGNAACHKNGHSLVRVDIKGFYQSVRRVMIRDFFAKQMLCATDIADLLGRIVCHGGALPTGSPVSPVLSYFACSAMFEHIARLASSENLIFSLYVDDMVFSGATASREFARRIVDLLSRYGFIGHKLAFYEGDEVKVVTGAAVFHSSLGIPFRRQKRMRLFEKAFWRCSDPRSSLILGTTLLGQFREAERLESCFKLRAHAVQMRMNALAVVARRERNRGEQL